MILNLDSAFSTSGNLESQSITIEEGRDSFLQFRLLNDLNTEKEESLNIQFYLDPDKTTQVGEASTIINDTSTGNLQGTYNIITRPSDFIYEGHDLFVTLETKNLPDTELDAQLWMRLSGTNILSLIHI